MAINLGSTAIADAKLGAEQVDKIYLGEQVVWSNTPPTPTEPPYGEVVLYGYTQASTNISNITGGTVTVTDDDMFKMTFSGEMMGTTYVCPINITISGDDPTDYWGWSVSGTDANGTPVYVDMLFDDPGISISGVSGSFTVSFRINSFAGLVIDKTTTTTHTLASATEFNQLAGTSSTVLGDVPKGAVKSVEVGTDITSIPDRFLYACSNLQSVTFSSNSSVSSIGSYFLGSISSSTTSIARIDLPESLRTIGTYFLSSCTAYNQPLAIPTGVTSIGDRFLNPNSSFNSSVTLPTTLTTVGNYFMASCTSFNQPLTIPGSITSLGTYFLSGCTRFNSTITIASGITSISNYFVNGCTAFNKALTVPEGVTTIGTNFLYRATALNSTVSLPSTLNTIGNSFMSSCSKFNQSLTIPASVTTIGTGFLSSCAVFNKPITVPSGVTTVGNNFLSQCTAFNSAVTFLTTTALTIGTNFLYSCTNFNQPLTLPVYLRRIGTNFLSGCAKFNQDITFPQGAQIERVEGYFLYNANAMVHSIILNSVSSGAFIASSYSLSTTSSAAAMYTTGITIKGTNRAAFMSSFPNRTSSPYRKLIDGEE